MLLGECEVQFCQIDMIQQFSVIKFKKCIEIEYFLKTFFPKH